MYDGQLGIHFGWKKTAQISSGWVKNTTRNSIWNKLDFLLSSKERTYLRFSYISSRNPQNVMISWLNHILNVNLQTYFDVRDSFRRNLSPKISADVLKMTCIDDFRRRFTRVFSLLAPKICNFRWFCVPNVSLDILYVF